MYLTTVIAFVQNIVPYFLTRIKFLLTTLCFRFYVPLDLRQFCSPNFFSQLLDTMKTSSGLKILLNPATGGDRRDCFWREYERGDCLSSGLGTGDLSGGCVQVGE
jgi:hypothetical protein